jgi:hypothetical protein
LLVLAIASSAFAEGSETIAGAPTVAFGQQEFGFIGLSCGQVWLLPVVAGDKLVIDWEAATDPYLELHLHSVGSNDFNASNEGHIVATAGLNSNKKAEFTYTAPQTGNMPLGFLDSGCSHKVPPGAYSFTAFVTHILSVGLPHLSTLHLRGSVTVAIHNPEGGVIDDPALNVTLQIKGQGRPWQTIGTATDGNSAATIHYKTPRTLRGRRVTLRALAQGPEYASAASTDQKVRVQ